MSQDLAPGTEVEFYRGTEFGPFRFGARFTVARVFKSYWWPCGDCLPGWDAPVLELVEVPVHPTLDLCSCCFRPVRRGQSEQSKQASTPAPPRECEVV